MKEFYRQFFMEYRDIWLSTETVGECFLAFFLFILMFPFKLLQFIFIPFLYLFSLPVHRGDKK